MIFELARRGKSQAVDDRRSPLEQIAETHGYIGQGRSQSKVVAGAP